CSPLLQFTYLSVSGVSPNAGPAAGMNGVAITGTGFQHMAGVYFGGLRAGFAVAVSDTRIIALVPPGSGTVDVRVVTAGGASPASPADQYSYGGAPTSVPVTPPPGGVSSLPCQPPPASAGPASFDPA